MYQHQLLLQVAVVVEAKAVRSNSPIQMRHLIILVTRVETVVVQIMVPEGLMVKAAPPPLTPAAAAVADF
jgi:hypothetical protein